MLYNRGGGVVVLLDRIGILFIISVWRSCCIDRSWFVCCNRVNIGKLLV